MKLVSICFAAAAIAGCATRDSDHGSRNPPHPPAAEKHRAPAPKETRVFDIKSSDDLLALDSQYSALWESGFEGTVEVNIGPGPLAPSGWSLHPGTAKGEPRIDLVLRGSGGVFPLPGRIRARSVRIENVILTGTRSAPAEIRVSTEFAMKRVMLVDGRFADPNFEGGWIEVFADGGKRSAARAAIEDSWFVRNYQLKAPMRLVSFLSRGEDGGAFERVRVAHSAFLGNAFAVDLGVDFATSVGIEDSFFYRNWPTGSELRCASCGAVTVERSAFAVERLDEVASVEATPPVLVRGSRILLRDGKASAKSPALSVAAAQIEERGASADAAVAEIITGLTAQPLKMPSSDVWERLEAVFRAPR